MSNSIDSSSYNFKDPVDLEKFFLNAHAELMSMYSRMVTDVNKINDFVHQLDLYTIDQNVIQSLSELVDANLACHKSIAEFFHSMMKIRELNLLMP